MGNLKTDKILDVVYRVIQIWFCLSIDKTKMSSRFIVVLLTLYGIKKRVHYSPSSLIFAKPSPKPMLICYLDTIVKYCQVEKLFRNNGMCEIVAFFGQGRMS